MRGHNGSYFMFHNQKSIYHSPCFWTEQEMHYSWLKTKYMNLDNNNLKKIVVSVKLDSSQDMEEKHTNNNHHYVTAIIG